MPYANCLNCTKLRYVKPSHLIQGWGKYCSHSCQAKFTQTKGQFFKCGICKKEVWRMPKEQKKSKSGLFFCSKKCSMSWKNSTVLSRENHPNWGGGLATYRDYMIRKGGEKVCSRCGINDFRVLAVHHIDHDRNNNSLQNLLWLCRNCHCLEHLKDADKNA